MERSQVAKLPNSVETLPKISIAWVGCTNVTDDRQTTDRQTDGRTTTYSEHEHEFTFANENLQRAITNDKGFCVGCLYGTCSQSMIEITVFTVRWVSYTSVFYSVSNAVKVMWTVPPYWYVWVFSKLCLKTSGGGAVKEQGHFQVRKSSNQVTRMHLFLKNSWRPQNAGRQHRQNETNNTVKYGNFLFIVFVHTVTEGLGRAEPGLEPGRWIFQPGYLTWRAWCSAATVENSP